MAVRSLVWNGMVWCGCQELDLVWYGMALYSPVAVRSLIWDGMAWYGMVWYGMVWSGMVCGCQELDPKLTIRGHHCRATYS